MAVSANPKARHHHGAMTGEPRAATVICERAPPLPVKSVDPPLAASVWSSVAVQPASRFSAPWDRKPGSPSGSLSAWPVLSAAARAGARRADPRLPGRHRPGMAGIPHVRHAERLFGDPYYLVRVATADLASQALRDEEPAGLDPLGLVAAGPTWRLS